MSLFKEPILLTINDGEVLYYPHFFDVKKADYIFTQLQKDTPWQEDNIKVFGKVYKQPRLTSLYGNENKSYSYSNITMYPHKFSPLLNEIKSDVEAISIASFNTVLLNLYRNGKDSNGWHADDEKELGKNPAIASLSFGEERYFHLRHKKDKTQKHKLLLNHGSLLLMKGPTQHHWHHQIPKTSKQIGPRINLTFRKLV